MPRHLTWGAAVLAAALCACGSDGIAPPATGTGGSSGGGGGGSGMTGGNTGGGNATGGAGPSTGGSSGNTGGAGQPGTGGSSAPPPRPDCSNAPAPTPAPPSTWANATGSLAGMKSDCGNLSKIAAVPCSRTLLAQIRNVGMFATEDGGKSWHQLGKGAGSVPLTNYTTAIVFDPKNPAVFWETDLFGPASAMFRSRDAGNTFELLFKGSMAQLVSVDFSDPDRKTLVLGIHGSRRAVHKSSDGGLTWTNIGMTLPAETHNSESPIVIDAQTYLLGACGYGDGVCGIYRTTDGGATWKSMTDAKIGHYGNPLWAADGTIYWPLLDTGGLAKSTDRGLTWTKISVDKQLMDVTPHELPDGSLISLSTTNVVRSRDGGMTWQPIGPAVPFKLDALRNDVVYVEPARTLFVRHADCGQAVLSDAVMSIGFDHKN